eukprot:1224815-Pyramimonas_sp.AAC.1
MTVVVNSWPQLHRPRAGRFQFGSFALAPRAFVFMSLQKIHGLRASRFQDAFLVQAPRTLVLKSCKNFMA